MNKWALWMCWLCAMSDGLYGVLAGGRPNAVSGGQNAFAGVVNPANSVWVEDRVDVGGFFVHQTSFLRNQDHNPFFPPGSLDQTYRVKWLSTVDAAIHKRFLLWRTACSLSGAFYTTPGYTKLRTKTPLSLLGQTPVIVENKTEVCSAVFSCKIHPNHSFGMSMDYFMLSHRRNGFQNADNPFFSVSPGHVTNRGKDRSSGVGWSVGWRWKVDDALAVGLVFVKKSSVGQYRKYRGYEPDHAKNSIPKTIGGGCTYHFSSKMAGRLEFLWTGLGDLPNANNAIEPDGTLNLHKKGSKKSSGPGLQNATYLNVGLGYAPFAGVAVGLGFSHRFKHARRSPYILSHGYMRQITYDLITIGANVRLGLHDWFFSLSHGLSNHQSGTMPKVLGGGNFSSVKHYDTLSFAWGYLY